MAKKKQSKDIDKAYSGAVLASVLWVMVVPLFSFCYLDSKGFSPNELGDFLAGLFSPVAFLWLVIGYRQNSKSILLQADEISLQTQELNNSVKEQQESNVIFNKQLENTAKEAIIRDLNLELNELKLSIYAPYKKNLRSRWAEYSGRDPDILLLDSADFILTNDLAQSELFIGALKGYVQKYDYIYKKYSKLIPDIDERMKNTVYSQVYEKIYSDLESHGKLPKA